MYKVTIGLEVHCELEPVTKVFSGASAKFTEEPNVHVSAIDLGFPGILPSVNEEAVNMALKVALALHCNIPDYLTFDRKNYYYPDLPKGYQITQSNKPIGTNGYLNTFYLDALKKVSIHDIHLEEDAASLDHFDTYSLINYNRCGIPLIETVTEPCMHSKEEALTFLETLRTLILYCGVSQARSDRGQMRCDVNVSLSKDDTLGCKVEVKNVNSFYNVGQTIDYEIKRQTEILDAGKEVAQETRRFDETTQKTIYMRSKVDAIDYKYYVEPNIPPIMITRERLDRVTKTIPMLQTERVQKYVLEYGLSKYDAMVIAKTKEVSDFFNECINIGCDPKQACNWISGMLLGYLNANETTLDKVNITPGMIKDLIDLIDKKTISSKQAKEVFECMIETGKEPNLIVKEKGMMQITDEEEILNVIKEVFEENEEEVRAYNPEKGRMIDFFVGQVMKKTKGKANPSKTMEMLKEELKKIKS